MNNEKNKPFTIKFKPSLMEQVERYIEVFNENKDPSEKKLNKAIFFNNILYGYFKRKIITNDFITLEKPFYFNIDELFENKTIKASTNKPSTDFNKYYIVKKISNNLDSWNSNFNTFCYNDSLFSHKGIFIFYIFTNEANPVPLVMDYNNTDDVEELTISLIKLSDLNLLIESSKDIITVKDIIESVEENVKKWNLLSTKELDFIVNEEDKFYINFMASITEVIEDFKGKKQLELLIKYSIHGEDLVSLVDENEVNSNGININSIESLLQSKLEFDKIKKELLDLEKKLNSEDYRQQVWEEIQENDFEELFK